MKTPFNFLIILTLMLLSNIIYSQSVPSYVPTNGLVGWWGFNGNAQDGSGNGNHGTVNGATLTTDRFGNQNSAYFFNGTSNLIQVSSTGQFASNSITINGWLKIQNIPPLGIVFIVNGNQSSARWAIGYNNLGFYNIINHLCSGQSQNNFGLPPSANQWINITYVITPSTVIFYKNGTLVSSQNNTAFSSSCGSNNLYFGYDVVGAPEYYSGKMDDIGIWNRALTQQEISNLFNGCQLAVNTQPANQTININNNAQFIVGSSDTNATYQWQTDLGVGFQNLNSVLQYSGTTNDTLTVSNVTMSNNNQPFRCFVSSGSCSDTSNVAVLTVNNNVGINEPSQDKLFSVFPNPTQSLINVKVDTKLIGNNYSIYDNSGKVVLSGKLKSENTTIELGNLSGGIYLFSVGDILKQNFKIIKSE